MTDGSLFPALRGRRAGTLAISPHDLVFTPDDSSERPLTFSPERIDIIVGGDNSPQFFIADREAPDDAVCVQDPAALMLLADYGVRAAALALAVTNVKRSRRAALLGSSFLLPVLCLIGIPFLLSFTPVAWLDGLLSHRQERTIGRALLGAAMKVDRGDASAERRALVDLVEFLRVSTPELAETDFEVYLSRDSAMNAFALPGGIIVVNRGLLSRAKSPEEVLGVLAHEMAHVEARHTLKAMAGRLGFLVGYLSIAAIAGTDAAGVAAQAGGLFTLKYSRDDESSADARGMEFLRNARVSPSGMIDFFSRLEVEQAALGKLGAAIELLSTHPLSSERVARIREFAATENYTTTREFPASLRDLKIGEK